MIISDSNLDILDGPSTPGQIVLFTNLVRMIKWFT